MSDFKVVLNDDETQLINEGLHELLKVKREALKVVNEGLPRVPFGPRDFAIPQIEALLLKLDDLELKAYEREEREAGGDPYDVLSPRRERS